MRYEMAVTRFNNKTWGENVDWRQRYHWSGCAYCCRVPIRDSVPEKIPVFVLEMNNDANQIMGIGLVKNVEKMARNEYVNFHRPISEQTKEWYEKNKDHKEARRFIIYSEKCQGYNNYIYKSPYRIDAADFNIREKRVFYVLEHLVFKGWGHLKRGQGITIFPEWIKKNTIINFIEEFKEMFKRRSC